MYKNSRQIIKTANKNKIIEFNDFLNFNDFNEDKYGQIRSTVHSRGSKIEIKIVDYTNQNNVFYVHHKLDPHIIKTISSQILGGNYKLFVPEKTKESQNFSELKVDPYRPVKGTKGFCNASKIGIWFLPSKELNNHWYISIVNGIAVPAKNKFGGVAMKKDTFKETNKSFVYLSTMEIVTCLNTVSDYIKGYEYNHMTAMLENREKYEKKVRQSKDESDIINFGVI